MGPISDIQLPCGNIAAFKGTPASFGFWCNTCGGLILSSTKPPQNADFVCRAAWQQQEIFKVLGGAEWEF
jgi:hypothetical protein